jgi:hypothetical protein
MSFTLVECISTVILSRLIFVFTCITSMYICIDSFSLIDSVLIAFESMFKILHHQTEIDVVFDELVLSHFLPLHHITSHHIISHHITSHHIILHHITSYHIILHHITSYHITSYLITSYHIISHHIISHHITSHYISAIT